MGYPVRDQFWRRKTLAEMTTDEWEALCDGCGRCCLHKLEDEDSGQVFYTDVACRLLDSERCRCSDYLHRCTQVPACLVVRELERSRFRWLPATCAYRRLAEGRDLPQWHHLVCGDREAVHRAGISVRGRTVPEEAVGEDEWEEHVVEWFDDHS